MPVSSFRLRTPRARHAFAALLVGGVCLVVAGSAAAGGELAFRGCLSDSGLGGFCVGLSGEPLRGASAVAVSPDGSSAYVAAARSGAIAHLPLAIPGGAPAFGGCVSDDGAEGACADLPGAPLTGASGVAVGPDGATVYVVAARSRAIASFIRLPGGALAPAGCIADDGRGGVCSALPGSPLEGASGIAVSPDGRSVYVASATAGSVTHFLSGGVAGLTFAGCLSDHGAGGACVDLPGSPLEGASGIAVSPDGRSVYVASAGAGSLAHLARGAFGEPSFRGCLAGGGADGSCAGLPGRQLEGASGVAVSPDGASVYVVSSRRGSVSSFTRGGGGELAFAGCLSDDGAGGACAELSGSPLAGANGVAVSPDGASVYVASASAGSVAHFVRAGPGPLSFGGCLAAGDAGGACVDLPGAPIRGATGVTVGPGGTSVYVASESSHSIAHFFRAPVAPGRAAASRATCAGRPVTVLGTPAADRLFGTAGRDVIAGRGGDDLISGLGGDDAICGGAGRDTAFGGPGRDVLIGGAGRDRIRGGPGRDHIRGGPGGDALRGGAQPDALRGGAERDVLRGGSGADLLLGGLGLDVLRGGPGADAERQ